MKRNRKADEEIHFTSKTPMTEEESAAVYVLERKGLLRTNSLSRFGLRQLRERYGLVGRTAILAARRLRAAEFSSEKTADGGSDDDGI